jgi:hypothetical protein
MEDAELHVRCADAISHLRFDLTTANMSHTINHLAFGTHSLLMHHEERLQTTLKSIQRAVSAGGSFCSAMQWNTLTALKEIHGSNWKSILLPESNWIAARMNSLSGGNSAFCLGIMIQSETAAQLVPCVYDWTGWPTKTLAVNRSINGPSDRTAYSALGGSRGGEGELLEYVMLLCCAVLCCAVLY